MCHEVWLEESLISLQKSYKERLNVGVTSNSQTVKCVSHVVVKTLKQNEGENTNSREHWFEKANTLNKVLQTTTNHQQKLSIKLILTSKRPKT